jgi:hypothetical protein
VPASPAQGRTRNRRMPSARSLPRKTALSLGALVVALLAAEVGLRLFKDVDELSPGGEGLGAAGWADLIRRPSQVPGLA